jgi:hypothetical protein
MNRLSITLLIVSLVCAVTGFDLESSDDFVLIEFQNNLNNHISQNCSISAKINGKPELITSDYIMGILQIMDYDFSFLDENNFETSKNLYCDIVLALKQNDILVNFVNFFLENLKPISITVDFNINNNWEKLYLLAKYEDDSSSRQFILNDLDLTEEINNYEIKKITVGQKNVIGHDHRYNTNCYVVEYEY